MIAPWDPALLAQVDDLEWRSRVLVEGFLAGPHRSSLRGYSAEFAQYHAYNQGEDPRHLDWKAYARFDRLYIREYDAETNLRLQVVLDGSGSMDYASGTGWSKWAYASTLAAGILRLAAKTSNAYGITVVGDEATTESGDRGQGTGKTGNREQGTGKTGNREQGTGTAATQGHRLADHLPARLGGGHFPRCLAAIQAHTPGGTGGLGRALDRLGEILPRRGAVVVLSDGWEDLDGLLAGLARLRHEGHDLSLFQIADPLELSFAVEDSGLFEDPETGARLPVTPAWARTAYLARLAEHQERLTNGCRALDVVHALLPTDTAPFAALAGVLAKRAGRGGGR